MIHPETEESALYDEAQAAYLRAHPFISHEGLHNDLAAIEWRHGYLVGRNSGRYREHTPEQWQAYADAMQEPQDMEPTNG